MTMERLLSNRSGKRSLNMRSDIAVKYAARGVVWGLLALAAVGWVFGGITVLAAIW